jgi:hypothetical protein
MRMVRTIPVRDANGDQLSLYECENFRRMPILGFRRRASCFKLETGELVDRVDDQTFAVASTGETLTRIG